MNIFEGSRRVAYLIGGLAAAGTIIYTATYDPYISLDYSIAHPRDAFVKTTERCPTNAGRAYFQSATQSGTSVSINLCLPTMAFGDNGRQLVPYKIDEKNMTWGAEPYSDEVSAYKEELEARFALSAEDSTWVEGEKSRRYWKNWKESLGILAIGLTVFAGLVWAVGWIVRGFMGIPRGMDKKREKQA